MGPTLRLLLLATFGVGSVQCRSSAEAVRCERSSDDTIVACVDGVPVTRAQVEGYVEEPWWTPGSAILPNVRNAAVERAERTALFAAEAKRRKLVLAAGTPDAHASWAQALIAAELAKRGISRDAIPDDEAARYYSDNKALFSQLDRVEVQLIAFKDASLAASIYADATKAGEDGFRALVAKHSVDEKTKANGGIRVLIASTDEDRPMLKMALTLRKPGAVGGPFKAGDGLWYLLRVKAAPVEHAKSFDELMKLKVKNVLVDQRRHAVIDELDRELRAKATIEVFDDALAKVTVPEFK